MAPFDLPVCVPAVILGQVASSSSSAAADAHRHVHASRGEGGGGDGDGGRGASWETLKEGREEAKLIIILGKEEDVSAS